MSLTAVKISEEVWLTCLTHALSTETEEIMGLLLGDIQYSSSGSATALIWGASPQTRSDRRKDRVETNPEQLAAASAQAERMTQIIGTKTRVIGWYHSHPHITVLPSHVDVRTQAMYQLLDPGFIGLIFSCFSEDSQKVGRIQVISFQSLDGKQSKIFRTVPASPVNNNSIIDVESSWSSSENALSTVSAARFESLEPDTGDSRLATASLKGMGKSSELEKFFAHAEVNYVGRGRSGGEHVHGDSPQNAGLDIDSMDMSASMQEAMHRSNLEMSGAEFIRKEIPLHVLPTGTFLKPECCPLASFTAIQHVLFEEERTAYNQAMTQNVRDGKLQPLAFIHHSSTYHAAMCKLMEYCLNPAISALQDRLKENEIRLNMLMEEAKQYEVNTANRSSDSGESPHQSPTHARRSSLAFSPSDSAGSRSPSGFSSKSRKSS